MSNCFTNWQMMGFLMHVVRDEDYHTGNLIQKTVKTGAKQEFLFGPCPFGHEPRDLVRQARK